MYYRENGNVIKHKVNRDSIEKFKYVGDAGATPTPTPTAGPTNDQTWILYTFIALGSVGILLLIISLSRKYIK